MLSLGSATVFIVINGIADNLVRTARLFADDTLLSYSSVNLSEIQRILNEDLEN